MRLTHKINEEEKQKIFQAYTTSFPEDERRNDDDFWKLFDNTKCIFIKITKNEKFVGYTIIWGIGFCMFIEVFEIFEEFRGQKLGSEALQILIQAFGDIILETEPQNLNKTAQKRVAFYEKNGFSILDKNYIQPSYGEGKNAINLWLMGNRKAKYLDKIINEIYKIVYLKN